MSETRWRCFLVAGLRMTPWEDNSRRMLWTLPDGREVAFDELPVGAMWTAAMAPADSYYHGPAYKPTDLFVVLPGKTIWHMNDKGTDGCSWTISGTPPDVTAMPSINYVGRYHGYVKNGHVTDDVDGRSFDDSGKLTK